MLKHDALVLIFLPFSQAPVYNEDEKTVCCLCCATGPVSVSASTDKRAYLPGETIYISASLDNKSNRSVHSLEAELIQVLLSIDWSPVFIRNTGTGLTGPMISLDKRAVT